MAQPPRRPIPKRFPPPEFPPRRLPLFARMPPAVFPALLGLIGLGLALRRGLAALFLPGDLAELVLGVAAALWLFAGVAYGIKYARRPGVLIEDLRVLPGRAGLATATMRLMALSAVLAPYAPGLARVVLVIGLLKHAVLAGLVLRMLRAGPPEQRHVNPTWHLSFVGFIVGGLAAPGLGWAPLAQGLVIWALLAALAIWGLSARQLLQRVPPAPLRPLLAIHLAPAALIGLVAFALGWNPLAQLMALLGGLILVMLVAAGRWIIAAGYSALWAAFTFPVGSAAGLMLALGGNWLVPGVAVLFLAIGAVPVICYRVLKSWADGSLADRSNAATA